VSTGLALDTRTSPQIRAGLSLHPDRAQHRQPAELLQYQPGSLCRRLEPIVILKADVDHDPLVAQAAGRVGPAALLFFHGEPPASPDSGSLPSGVVEQAGYVEPSFPARHITGARSLISPLACQLREQINQSAESHVLDFKLASQLFVNADFVFAHRRLLIEVLTCSPRRILPG